MKTLMKAFFLSALFFALLTVTQSCKKDKKLPTIEDNNGNNNSTTEDNNNSTTEEDNNNNNSTDDNNNSTTEDEDTEAWLIGTWKIDNIYLNQNMDLTLLGFSAEENQEHAQTLVPGASLYADSLLPILEAISPDIPAILHIQREGNDYIFEKDGTFEVDGNPDFILQNAGASGSWSLNENILTLTKQDGSSADVLNITDNMPPIDNMRVEYTLEQVPGGLKLIIAFEKQ